MFETVIVGGGLCGMMLADGLRQDGQPYVLFEARTRLGGRIKSEPSSLAGMPVDLGPTWFWPDVQPRMLGLVESLRLAHFPQYDNGEILSLTDPNKSPESLSVDSVHGGAHRLAGGMVALVSALAQRLDPATIHLQHVLQAMEDKGDHIELLFLHADSEVLIRARRVVLAMPPRLLAEHVSFAPALDRVMSDAMQATPTWMADQAKAVMGYPSAFWRAAGHSGNAFVNHAQVVLAEVYDACDANAGHAALGGFVALSAEARAPYLQGMPLLIESQLGQLFGLEAANGELQYQDWAAEPYTCASLDLNPPETHPVYGNHRLRESLWGGKLLLGGSETAGQGGGYMEGALDAAARLRSALSASHVPAQLSSGNADGLHRFGNWVAAQRSHVQDRYRSHLHRALAEQHKQQLTQRALLDTAEQMYSEALQQLDALPLDTRGMVVEQGRSQLTPIVLTPFNGFIRELVDEALEFNRSSCAISNFPAEHVPDPQYMEAIRRDLSAAWREFALSVNDALLAKCA